MTINNVLIFRIMYFQNFFENELEDYELQSFLLSQDADLIKKEILSKNPKLKSFIQKLSSEDLLKVIRDFGGHDFESLINALRVERKLRGRPRLIIAHTLKGWGLSIAASSGNHSALITDEELSELKKKTGIKNENDFERFSASSAENEFLSQRGDELYQQILKMKLQLQHYLHKYPNDRHPLK